VALLQFLFLSFPHVEERKGKVFAFERKGDRDLCSYAYLCLSRIKKKGGRKHRPGDFEKGKGGERRSASATSTTYGLFRRAEKREKGGEKAAGTIREESLHGCLSLDYAREGESPMQKRERGGLARKPLPRLRCSSRKGSGQMPPLAGFLGKEAIRP